MPDLVTILLVGVRAVMVVLGAFKAWHDPDNWVLDAQERRIRYRNWTELLAYGAIFATLTVVAILFAL